MIRRAIVDAVVLPPVSQKIPGWGFAKLRETRIIDDQLQGLVESPDHEAPFWVDLQEVAFHNGRMIYKLKETDDE